MHTKVPPGACLPVEEDVLRLDVSMYVVLVVEVPHSPQHLHGGGEDER